jgi:hypothetical protein
MGQTLIPNILSGSSKAKQWVYWITTTFLAFELFFGATWDFDLVKKGFVSGILTHLGYPVYLSFILGCAKIPAGVAILMPGYRLLKEWAYAGAFFLFAGACASHLIVRDPLANAIYPLTLAIFTLLSWWLRPATRKVAG